MGSRFFKLFIYLGFDMLFFGGVFGFEFCLFYEDILRIYDMFDVRLFEILFVVNYLVDSVFFEGLVGFFISG